MYCNSSFVWIFIILFFCCLTPQRYNKNPKLQWQSRIFFHFLTLFKNEMQFGFALLKNIMLDYNIPHPIIHRFCIGFIHTEDWIGVFCFFSIFIENDFIIPIGGRSHAILSLFVEVFSFSLVHSFYSCILFDDAKV